MPITAAISRFISYRIRISRRAVKPSIIAMKMIGFSIDAGSANATTPDACTGSASRRAPISTARSRMGIAMRGMMFFVSKQAAPDK